MTGAWHWKRRPGAPPLIFAHRGARARAPENTMAAFELARAERADAIELDVRTTADGVVVVMHDVDLARMTDQRDLRRVATMTFAELRAVELAGGTRAPSLVEVLDWADGCAMAVNVELKHDVPDERRLAHEVARLLRARGRVAARVILSSFQPRLLAWSRLLVPSVPRALLVHDGQRLARTPVAAALRRAVGAIALHPERTLCVPSRLLRWSRGGALLNVWTVNAPSEARGLARRGVDGLITDDPAALRHALATSP